MPQKRHKQLHIRTQSALKMHSTTSYSIHNPYCNPVWYMLVSAPYATEETEAERATYLRQLSEFKLQNQTRKVLTCSVIWPLWGTSKTWEFLKMYGITFSVHWCACHVEAHSSAFQILVRTSNSFFFPQGRKVLGSVNCLPESHSGRSSQWWCNAEASWKIQEIRL